MSVRNSSHQMAGRQERATDGLPENLQWLFWEYDFYQLSWKEDRDLIVARVLARGDWKAVEWLNRMLSLEEVRLWIQKHQGKGLDARQLRFWELVCDLPHSQVNAWLKARAPDIWERRQVP